MLINLIKINQKIIAVGKLTNCLVIRSINMTLMVHHKYGLALSRKHST